MTAPSEDITTDYLVVGAGVAGLGFVDQLLTRTSATITICDKRDAPGGHWKDAYPYVRLHGPSNFYGVESMEIEPYRVEEHGPNKGYMPLATGSQLVAYFSEVMRKRFLGSGRVTYLPSTEYVESEGVVRGVFSGRQQAVKVKKVVIASYGENSIPLTHKPSFTIAPGAKCIPPNDLPRLAPNFPHFTVLGGGKTGVDACMWLLSNGVDPERLRWVIPNDYWYLNRSQSQFAPAFYDVSSVAVIERLEAMAEAESVVDFTHRLEKSKVWHRLDTAIEPRHFHSAVISLGEMEELRKIKDIVRQGHVTALNADHIVLTKGKVAARPDSLYIDCTATAFPWKPATPIFQGKKRVLQLVRSAMPSVSVSVIAFVESLDMTDEERNELLRPVPYARTTEDYISELMADLGNQIRMSQNKDIQKWTAQSRMSVAAHMFGWLKMKAAEGDADAAEKMARFGKAIPAAAANLPKLAKRTWPVGHL